MKRIVFSLGLCLMFSSMILLMVTTPKVLTDCSQPPNIIYLKPDEASQAPDIINSGTNMVVVIPETNAIRARSDLLVCNNLDLNSYIDLGELGW